MKANWASFAVAGLEKKTEAVLCGTQDSKVSLELVGKMQLAAHFLGMCLHLTFISYRKLNLRTLSHARVNQHQTEM